MCCIYADIQVKAISGTPDVEQLKQEQELLREESLKKDQRIRTLMEEVTQKNMHIRELTDKNEKLLAQVENINKSKVALAVNADQTINELRKYLMEYQQAFQKASQAK